MSAARSTFSAAWCTAPSARPGSIELLLTGLLAEDQVLRQLGVGVQTTAATSVRMRSVHRLRLTLGRLHVGTEVAIQQLDLTLQLPDGGACAEDVERAVLQRAVAVLAERATRRVLPAIHIEPQPFETRRCVLYLLYRLSADATA